MAVIYIAGKYTSKERLREQRARLVAEGRDVQATWLDETLAESFDNSSMPPPFYGNVATEPQMVANARMDFEEARNAEIFILDTLDESPTGGREVEFGISLTRGNRCLRILIGPKRNIFHHLVDLHYDDWDDFWRHSPEEVSA